MQCLEINNTQHATKLPSWLKRTLLAKGQIDIPPPSPETTFDRVSSGIARMNLETAQQLIRLGSWCPSQGTKERLRELSQKYHPKLEACPEFF